MASGVEEPVQMNQDTANKLFQDGAMLIMLDTPQGTEFGIDYNSYQVGPKFKGVKMIPLGIHFVYYSAVSKEHQQAPRTGFFYNFIKGEIVVKKWDTKTEDFVEVRDEEELERLSVNKQELDQFLAPYPYESYKKWVSLTNHITPTLMQNLQPDSTRICAVPEFVSEGSTTESRRAAAELAAQTPPENKPPSGADGDDSRLPHMEEVPGTRLRFTDIPQKKYPEGASPEIITKYSMDHSYVLESLLNSVYPNSTIDLLGELQFAFICFLMGQVYSGFEQWKKLVQLLCCSDEALNKHNQLFDQFVSVMHYQVREIPEDFFVDIVTRNNFLTTTLAIFFSNIQSSTAKACLKSKSSKFREHLEKKFKWDFTENEFDEAPVIVEKLF